MSIRKHSTILLVFSIFFIENGFCQNTDHKGSNSSVAKRGIEFTFRTEGPIRTQPAISGKMLFIGSGDGTMYAIDKLTGKEYWRFMTGGPIFSSACTANGFVFFSSRDHFLYALQSRTGKLIWKYKFGNDLGDQNFWDYYLSSPIADGNDLFIGSGDGFFYAFELKTGKTRWKYDTKTRIRSTPAVTADKIIFGTMSGHVIALNKKGKEQWVFATDGTKIKFTDRGLDGTSVFCTPSVKDNIVSVGGRDFILYTLDINSGKEIWRFDHKNSWVLSTAIIDDKVIAGSGSAAFVQANDSKTGQQLWRIKTKSAVYSSYSFSEGLVYFSDLSGNVYGVDIKTGENKWLFPLGKNSFATPVVSDGLIYCSSDEGVLYAVHGTTSSDTSFLHAKKIVYWEGNLTDSAYHYFNFNVDLWIRDYLKRQDYELMDAGKLKTFMLSRINDASRTVVVFADNKVPPGIIDEKSENSIIRKYLNAGGKVVFLGTNPLFVKTNPLTGVLVRNPDAKPASEILGIDFSPWDKTFGHHVSFYNKEGNRLGLHGFFTGFWPVDPDKVSSVLALDEYGKAEAWIKYYGGPEGSGLLQLCINPPGVLGADFFPMRAAIEYGINW